MTRFFSKIALILSVSIVGISGSAHTQGLQLGELSQAQAFEPGTLSGATGALSSTLWVGTQAETAENLINALPDDYTNPVARDLVRRVLLSPGAPPSGSENGRYQATRINGIIRLSELAAAQDIAARSPALASSDILKADLALLAGDMEAACQKSDSIIDGRSEAYWMKLRALCHVQRNEKAAAEVTLDLLKNSGDDDKYFERLLRHLTGIPGTPDLAGMPSSPLYVAMMSKTGLDWPGGNRPPAAAARTVFNSVADPDQRLAALMRAGPALSDAQIQSVIESFAEDSSDTNSDLAGLAGGATDTPTFIGPDLTTALEDNSAKGFSQLFTLARTGSPEDRLPALMALLKRAESKGGFERISRLMSSELQFVDYTSVLATDIRLLTRAAILRNDLGALQQIYQALENNPAAQERVALAADAIGNGFYGGNLGTDIDNRLEKPGRKSRALRDALLAYGLGAKLSVPALKAISDKNILGRTSGDLFALEVASQNRAQAETGLRAANLIEGENKNRLPDYALYKVVESLYQAGLTDEAARLAALDFIADMPE